MSKKVSTSERLSYGMAGLGQNIVYVLFSTQLFFFYTVIFPIDSMIIGIIMSIARIWDAVNDFIMGNIVDNTRTKIGKMRPFLKFSPIPIAILTVLVFLAPDLNESLKLIYVIVTYMLWDMAYTACDIPYWGLSAVMTDDVEEKNRIISETRALTMIGSGIGIVGIPLLIDSLGGDKTAYLVTAIIVAVIGCGLLSLSYFKTQERVTPPVEKTDILENISLLLNKPFLLIMIASLLGFGRNMSETVGMHFAEFNLGDAGLFGLLGGLLMSGVIMAIILTPYLNRFFSKRAIFVGSSFFGAIVYILMYFIGYDNLIITSVLLFLTSLPMGFYTVLQTSIIADSVDYVEFNTSKRAEGVSFAGQTFITKLSTAFSIFVSGAVLKYTGFIEGAKIQTPKVHEGIYFLVTLVPAICCVLSAIPMLFYNFNNEDQKHFVEEINKRKQNESGDKNEENLV